MKIHRQLKNLWLRFGYSCINITLLILNFGLVWLLKIFYGEQAVIHFLPCPIWVADVSLMIQHVPTAQTNMKMCYMRFGTVQAYLQFGTKTLNGILGEYEFSYFPQLLSFVLDLDCSPEFFQCLHEPYGLGATRSDFLHQVFLLIKFCSEQLLLSWSFG